MDTENTLLGMENTLLVMENTLLKTWFAKN